MSSPSTTLPERFGRYEVQSLIGEGAMGRVYRAFDPLAHRVVAIKTLKSEYLTSETRDEYLRRFRREAQAAGGLSHSHIITVFDVGEDFFVMELLEGATLQAILRERGRIELADALHVLGPVADALDYAHRNGVIHRDIKPGNIIVLPDGRPKIMDFGVAHLASTVMTASGQFLGSPSYMAPEQITKSEVSPRTDLFSLAVLTYEILTGHKPFEGDSITAIIYKVVHEEPRPPRAWNDDLPAPYDDVFRRALDKDPEKRFASAQAFVAALELKEIDATLGPAPAAPHVFDIRNLPSLPEAVETYDLKAEEVARTMSAGAPSPPEPRPSEPRPKATPWRLRALVAVLLAVMAAAVALRRGPEAPPETSPPAMLRIQTEPPGAAVLLDGSEVGVSPIAVRSVASGTHTVRVTREGFAPAQLSFAMVAGVTMAPLRFLLQPTSATLRLGSDPAEAAVQVDGRSVGATPLDGLLLDPGSHEVRVEVKGFRPWSRRIEARAGETLELLAQLERVENRPAAAPARTAVPARASAPAAAPAPLGEGDLVAFGPDVTPPRKTSGDLPSYPEEARKLRLEGLVVIDSIIDEKGVPTEMRVIESAGEVLDRAVMDAVRKWRYEPALKQGLKVRVHWQTRHRFQIQG